MPLLTFEAVKAGDIPDVSGVCADSDQFRNYLNKATRMLMTRGDFWGTVEKIQICTYNSCLVWPDFVGTVLAVNMTGQSSTLANLWYQFMPLSVSDFCCGGFGFNGNSCTGNLIVRDDGVSPVYNPIRCGQNVYIRAYPSTLADVGKKTVIYGVDSNGQDILTQRGDGTWQPGIELTLAVPYVSTSFMGREITRIHKEVTSGPVRYYQYDLTNNLLLDLVILKPYETDPMYRRSRLYKGCTGGCTTSCNGLRSVIALVKLEFVPVLFDGDLVLISNQDALRDMILSIRFADSGDKEQAVKYELSAIHESNLEASNKAPKEQTPVEINAFGSALPVYHLIGRIT